MDPSRSKDSKHGASRIGLVGKRGLLLALCEPRKTEARNEGIIITKCAAMARRLAMKFQIGFKSPVLPDFLYRNDSSHGPGEKRQAAKGAGAEARRESHEEGRATGEAWRDLCIYRFL